jgi:hypothetical protein
MSESTYTPDSTKKPSRGASGEADEKVLGVLRSRLMTGISATSDTRTNQVNDLKFAAGSSDNLFQWPTDVQTARTAQGDNTTVRPMLTVNKLPQHIKQVTNDQRQNRPTGGVIPANGDASVEVAEMLEGIVKHIEYLSEAEIAYDTACDNQVTHGEGYWRILTDYDSPDSFDQEIYIKRIRNSFCVYLDPMIQHPCGADANWGIISEDLTHTEYEAQYPDAAPISSIQQEGVGNESLGYWLSEKTIRIAEYFYFETTTKKLYLFKSGKTAFEDTPEYEVYEQEFGKPVKSRDSQIKKVCWIKTNGYEILDKRDWPGSYIPIVRVLGNEWEIEGQIYISGIVRNAKDAQRMYNYWCSTEVEILALAPKAPFIGAAGQFEGFEKQWKTANTHPWAYLEYNPIVDEASGQVMTPPQRVQPPMVQNGIIAAKQGASEDIKDATGQYNASLGQTSNERSGKAILARQHEGDVSTFHYGDNLARAVRFSTRILVDLIPKIYDTQRIARIIGEDGKAGMIHIDPDQKSAVVKEVDPKDPNVVIRKIYNPNVGKYDVCVVSGPGYATKRREALDAMAQLLQATPELWHIAGDLFVKNMDWPGAQELAKRFQKTLDPKLLAGDDQSPELQKAQQQLQELMQQYNQAVSMLQNVQHSMEARELDLKRFEVQIKAYSAETDRIKVMQPAMDANAMHDIAAGTVDAARAMGDLIVPQAPPQEPQQPPQGAPGMPTGQAPQMPPQAPPGEPGPVATA